MSVAGVKKQHTVMAKAWILYQTDLGLKFGSAFYLKILSKFYYLWDFFPLKYAYYYPHSALLVKRENIHNVLSMVLGTQEILQAYCYFNFLNSHLGD